MPLTGQQSHIKEHARYIKSRNWRITVTNYRSFSKNSGVKQATYLTSVFCQSGKLNLFLSSLLVNVRLSYGVTVNLN